MCNLLMLGYLILNYNPNGYVSNLDFYNKPWRIIYAIEKSIPEKLYQEWVYNEGRKIVHQLRIQYPELENVPTIYDNKEDNYWVGQLSSVYFSLISYSKGFDWASLTASYWNSQW